MFKNSHPRHLDIPHPLGERANDRQIIDILGDHPAFDLERLF